MAGDKKQETQEPEKQSAAAKPGEEEEEEEEECGFCRYMKAGGCKKEFTAWSKCVDEHREGGRDFTEECRDATLGLQQCMLEHRDYYKDFLGEGEEAKGEAGGEGAGAAGKEGRGAGEGDSKAASKETGKQQAGGDDGKAAADDKPGGQKGDGGSSTGGVRGQQEALGRAQSDSLSKQARVVDQEMSPVKAKPDHGKREEAQAQPPKPEREGGAPRQAQRLQADEADSGAAEPGKQGGARGGEGEGNEGGEGEEEGAEEEQKPEIKVETVPNDQRFVTTNQARHCYTRYQEFHRCAAEKGPDSSECSFFARAYRSICPSEWVERWNEQREEGSFAGRY